MMEKLDLDKLNPETREFVKKLQHVLTAQDPTLIPEHIALARSAPHEFTDEMVLRDPAIVSLLMYGKPGLDALYSLAARDGIRLGFEHVRALVAVLLKRADLPRYEVRLSQVYLEDEVFNNLESKVTTTCSDPNLSSTAEELLSGILLT